MISFLKEPLAQILSNSLEWKTTQEIWGQTTIQFLDEGIIQLTPQDSSSGYALILSCGIHGNETAPIEMVCDLLQEVYSKDLLPDLPILIQFGNISAMKEQKRFLEFNLNRLFSGTYKKHTETLDAKRAPILEASAAKFAQKFKTKKLWHLDLHTAIRGSYHQTFAIRPFRTNQNAINSNSVSDEEIHFLKQMGIEAIVQSHSANTTYSSYSCNQHHATSFTLELGKVRPFGQNKKEDFISAHQALRSFISHGTPPQKQSSEGSIAIYEVVDELIRQNEETILHLEDDYHNFMPLTAGTPIQTTAGQSRLARDGEAVIFPNKKVKVGQRTGLVIAETSKI